MKKKLYIGDAGSKNPGLTALFRIALWNVVENDVSGDSDLIKDIGFDERGIFVVPEADRPEAMTALLDAIANFIPDCVTGISRNAEEAGEDPDAYLESVVNGGDEESGLYPVDGANYERGDEKLLISMIVNRKRLTEAEALDVLRRIGYRVIEMKSKSSR